MWASKVADGVRDDMPLVYLIQIETPFGARRYVGKAKTKTQKRLRKDYQANIKRIFEGKQKRGDGPYTKAGNPQKRSNIEYRYVHLLLAVAVQEDWPITHTAIENVPRDDLKRREDQLIHELNADLNDKPMWPVERFADLKAKVVAGIE
ncbi:hypothetical protein KUV73_25210 [Mameliella alba]|nr:hypothetical protein [Mameliella alba]MBY6170735.1 hypothetical protein [Mameliella alba]MBY6177675.1 hypothetical protein [Mameliella alba]